MKAEIQASPAATSVKSASRCLLALSDFELGAFLNPTLVAELRTSFGQLHLASASEMAPDRWKELLLSFDPQVLISCWSTPALPSELLGTLRLEYVCHLGGSVRRVVPRAWIEKGLLVTNWGQTPSKVVAECGLLMILSCLRRTTYWTRILHYEGGWKQNFFGQSSLLHRRVGLHGFGAIAREMVLLLKPFQTVISTYSPSVPDNLLVQYGVRRVFSIEELFSGNDIIVELQGLTEKTRGVVKEEHLRSIPKGGAFINLGRGQVVDEAGLIKVAQEGELQIALDVFHQEPLPAQYPLRGLSNVLLLPHIGGPTPDKMPDCGLFGMENVRRFLRRMPLESVIDLAVYDRQT